VLYVGWRVTGDWWDPACLPRRNTLQKGNRNTSQTPGTRHGIFCTIIKGRLGVGLEPAGMHNPEPGCAACVLRAPKPRPELATGGALK